MAVILGKLVDLYHFLNEDLSDPRTHQWFLMGTPFPGLAILGIYLYIIYKLGPKLMENRPAFSLRFTLIVYNAIQIASSLFIVYQSIALAWGNDYAFICQPVDISDDPVSIAIAYKICYAYFVVKLVDLLDTVFFVMRKKQKQISFLHVYHHTGMVLLSWSIVKWLPGGHGLMVILLNSIVHVVMYFYYMLTVIDESYKKSMWWKKHVTQLQIIQFVLMMSHLSTIFLKSECEYPKMPSVILIPQNVFMVTLFSDFYRKAYYNKKDTKPNEE